MQNGQGSPLPEDIERRDDEARLDAEVFHELEVLRTGKPLVFYEYDQAEPDVVDLSSHLRFVRRQGGAGCWGYSTVAVWDIMNDLACPFSPNMSMRLWMMLHRRRELWQQEKGIFSPDGRFHKMSNPEWGFLQSFGNTTEGTEPTYHQYPSRWHDGGWSREGVNEASNYRLQSEPLGIAISAQSFVNSLADGKPIRLGFDSHYIAVVGYDKGKKEFKYVNSAGQNWNNGGFGTLTFAEVDNHQTNNMWLGQHAIFSAEVFDIHPPKPVPAARIHIKHTSRGSVHLWLGAEDSPHPPLQIWPHGWNDGSADLHFTVRLPSEFIWPPSAVNRIVLDLYDAGTYSQTGGELVEFTAAFGLHTVGAPQLPAKFGPGDRLRICMP